MVLGEKAKKNFLVLLEDLKMQKGKTKELASLLHKLPCDGKRTLIVLPTRDEELIRAGNNLALARTAQARELNLLDVLQTAYLVMPKDTLQTLEETFAV